MKTWDKSAFFAELNLANLTESKKDQIWQKFLELVALEVLDKILAKLPQVEQERLFLNLAKKPARIEKFLTDKKFKPIFDSAVLKIKKQIFKTFDKK